LGDNSITFRTDLITCLKRYGPMMVLPEPLEGNTEAARVRNPT